MLDFQVFVCVIAQWKMVVSVQLLTSESVYEMVLTASGYGHAVSDPISDPEVGLRRLHVRRILVS